MNWQVKNLFVTVTAMNLIATLATNTITRVTFHLHAPQTEVRAQFRSPLLSAEL